MLRAADLTKADLDGALLSSADMIGAKTEDIRFGNAIINDLKK
ncbi:hypothetical protein SDC9_188550 [bioreactor metagenome]|uniref:Pentapeptide repeat protein MfpA n=1 Tax=bioreactor metagenome TaxID=1076179 RepID=A0A645HQ80_9ZZZZ